MAPSNRTDPVLGGLEAIISDFEGFYKDLHKTFVRPVDTPALTLTVVAVK